MSPKTLMLCDFDGTVSIQDVGHEVIRHFLDGDWARIDADYIAGRIGSMAAYRKIAVSLKMTRRQMEEYSLGLLNMDPGFKPFYRFCRDRGCDLKIVSDGLDGYIRFILEHHGLEDIEFFSNAIRFNGDRSVSIEFPHHNDECAKCGTCKTALLKHYRSAYERIIYVGDGYSDVCPARYADLVFGKAVLYEKCRGDGKPCVLYRNFQDVQNFLQANL